MNIFRAVLITGSPGIGKTTTAHLCAKLEGYIPIELNASDARSKQLVEVCFGYNCSHIAFQLCISTVLVERNKYQQYLFGWMDVWGKGLSIISRSLKVFFHNKN